MAFSNVLTLAGSTLTGGISTLSWRDGLSAHRIDRHRRSSRRHAVAFRQDGRAGGIRRILSDTEQESRRRRSVPTRRSSARAGWPDVLLNLCKRDHHHHWIDGTLVES